MSARPAFAACVGLGDDRTVIIKMRANSGQARDERLALGWQ